MAPLLFGLCLRCVIAVSCRSLAAMRHVRKKYYGIHEGLCDIIALVPIGYIVGNLLNNDLTQISFVLSKTEDSYFICRAKCTSRLLELQIFKERGNSSLGS